MILGRLNNTTFPLTRKKKIYDFFLNSEFSCIQTAQFNHTEFEVIVTPSGQSRDFRFKTFLITQKLDTECVKRKIVRKLYIVKFYF